jgi:glycosyltransferase involved in cell wall biosynthesis
MPTPVSLAIAIYNRESYLPGTIESILTQTYPHFELILWDDSSTDSSLKIAQHYATLDARVRVVAAAHQGFTPALKSALALTVGTYLGWVDSDDLLAPTALAETVAVLDSHPDKGLVYTDYQLIDEQDQGVGMGGRCTTPYDKNQLLVQFMVFHFRLMRRSVFEQVGGIDRVSGLVPDYDLCLRLSEVTEFYPLKQCLYSYRLHAASMSEQKQQQTIQDSKQAVNRALQRRGLADRYELCVQLSQLDNKLQSQFKLQAKARA